MSCDIQDPPAILGERNRPGLEPGVLPLGADLAQDRGIHGGHNVAESALTVDRVISRTLLRPRYGSGWQPE